MPAADAPPAEPRVAGEELLGIAADARPASSGSRASDRACLMTAHASVFTASSGASSSTTGARHIHLWARPPASRAPGPGVAHASDSKTDAACRTCADPCQPRANGQATSTPWQVSACVSTAWREAARRCTPGRHGARAGSLAAGAGRNVRSGNRATRMARYSRSGWQVSATEARTPSRGSRTAACMRLDRGLDLRLVLAGERARRRSSTDLASRARCALKASVFAFSRSGQRGLVERVHLHLAAPGSTRIAFASLNGLIW